MKKILKSRFAKLYPNKRLLAIILDGFYHSVFYDDGTAESKIKIDRYSNYMPENKNLIPLGEMFKGYENGYYQNNAKEIVYVKPNKR